MAKDAETYAHQEWLGYVQPVGLVVSIPALLSAQAYINKNIAPEHQRFLSCLPRETNDEVIPEIRDLPEFTQTLLGWESGDLVGCSDGEPMPTSLEVALPEYHETLRPTYAVREFEPKDADNPWLLLIQELPTGTGLDEIVQEDSRHSHGSPHAKFERLLRETQVPIGLLSNGTHLRLIYAPRGETSGYMTFVVNEMATVAGRPIFAAMHMLLGAERLFSLPEKQRLPAILADSRKYQNVVSTKLAEQVLAALYELLRGFQAADDQRKGELLRDVLTEDPNHVYAGLLTVLMRLVFVLYAEDRGLLSSDPLYTNYYSVTGLFERLRADAGRYPDTMDQRYGAWAQLLTLFRLIYEGGSHGGFHIPARKGYLFDPDRYNFLEGRHWNTPRHLADTVDIPRVSDGVIFRVLSNLLILDGERLSYRTLDVEQIGSVYETIMGFDLQVAQGCSIAIKPTKSHGAPTTINLEALLDTKPTDRVKWLREQTDQELTGQAATLLRDAETIEDLLAALEKKTAQAVTPNVVSKGAMVLQPSEERRRSGSHYTPRSLTEPIVRTTLRPILERLVESPTPEQILDLKVCDPAMGSGAFLVEACRQLGDELVRAWYAHDCVPPIPSNEDELLYARHLIVQRCLYGVDKNQLAVDLAKLSLWLATLAKDHPFTFVDHSLRHGDSLVGLTREQIACFHWAPEKQIPMLRENINKLVKSAEELRAQIQALEESDNTDEKDQLLRKADAALTDVRLIGDVVVAAFFGADKNTSRKKLRHSYGEKIERLLTGRGERPELSRIATALRESGKPIVPFHWQIEFPEVFTRENSGFDAVIGNPPFLGGTRISAELSMNYFAWLTNLYPPAGHLCDQVAYFFRSSYGLLRCGGYFGLIATNTVSQGDTREGGLLQIIRDGGVIYNAVRRYRWPGLAAVIVSVVHTTKRTLPTTVVLDGKPVRRISAFLLEGDVDDNPSRLARNPYFSLGSKIYGQGFLFDDTDPKANPLSVMNEIIALDPRSEQRIFPYIGGQELNTNPTLHADRFVIYLSDIQDEQELKNWSPLEKVVREKVKPERDLLGSNPNNIPLKRRWWAYQAHRPDLYEKIKNLRRVLACSQVSAHMAFAFLPSGWVYSQKLCLFVLSSDSAFCTMQSRVHEVWARFFSSTLKDDLNYTPSDCFETFPFPENFETKSVLDDTGREYYKFRENLMVHNNEGLTKTYNRFHDPDETSPDILKLRALHAAMDRAVLDAYGWDDLTPTWQFLLDYEEEEEEESGSIGPSRKKPWRYRWPDDFRDEAASPATRTEQATRRTGTSLRPRRLKLLRSNLPNTTVELLNLFSGLEAEKKTVRG